MNKNEGYIKMWKEAMINRKPTNLSILELITSKISSMGIDEVLNLKDSINSIIGNRIDEINNLSSLSCDKCKGEGTVGLSGVIKCDECNGTGNKITVHVVDAHLSDAITESINSIYGGGGIETIDKKPLIDRNPMMDRLLNTHVPIKLNIPLNMNIDDLF